MTAPLRATPLPRPEPRRGSPPVAPLRLIPGGREAVLRRRRSAAVYRRRRLVAAAVLVLLVLGVLVVGHQVEALLVDGAPAAPIAGPADPVASPAAGATGSVEPARVVVVQPGDTLWSIARRLRPEGEVRAVVDWLAERAGGTTLQPGQRLDVTGLVDG